jgi:hypothetical protein
MNYFTREEYTARYLNEHKVTSCVHLTLTSPMSHVRMRMCDNTVHVFTPGPRLQSEKYNKKRRQLHDRWEGKVTHCN